MNRDEASGPRSTNCASRLHDHPLPRGYTNTDDVAEQRRAKGWLNPRCPRCQAFGWVKPAVPVEHEHQVACLRCDHGGLTDHHAGGCKRCSCSSPFGGLT